MYSVTAWKVSKYGVISGPYCPVFGLNTEIYEVQENTDQKQLRIWNLHAVCVEESSRVKIKNNVAFTCFYTGIA